MQEFLKWLFDWMFAVGIHPEAKFTARVLALSTLCHMANVFKSESGILLSLYSLNLVLSIILSTVLYTRFAECF